LQQDSVNISVISDPEKFYLLNEEWNRLLKNSKNDTVFLRWEWLYNWWQVYGKGACRLFIIVVHDNGRLIGIAPFYIKKYLGFFREINFLGSNIVCSDYLDFILLKGSEKFIISLICSFLEQHKKAWDVLVFSDIPSVSSRIDLIESFFMKYRIVINKKYTTCPYIKLNSPWDKVYNSYTSILKNTIKRKSKKFEKNDDSGFVEIKPGEKLESYFPEFLHLNKLSLEKREIRSPFYKKDFLAFHEKIISELLDKGMVKFYFLKKDGKYIAGIYILFYESKYYYYQSGFDPVYEKESPGTLLFHYCIKAAHENGAKEFDFLQGDEPYKLNWTKNKRTNMKITIYDSTIAGMLIACSHYGTAKTKVQCKKIYYKLMKLHK